MPSTVPSEEACETGAISCEHGSTRGKPKTVVMEPSMTRDERPFPRPGAPANYGPDRPVRIRHIALHLRPDLPAKRIDAVATLTVEAIEDGVGSIVLDAVDLAIHSVRMDDRPLGFTSRARSLHITFAGKLGAGERATFAVAYAVVVPRRGVFFPEPDAGTPHKPRQLWTQCQPSDARYWVPCQDSPDVKASTTTTIVAPKPLFALGNGALLERRDDGEATIFVYDQTIPHAAYLLTLVVGEFEEIDQPGAAVPVSYYVAKGRKDEGERSFGATPEMLRVLSDFTGMPYPFARYGQIAVADFTMGGMENTTATTQTDLTLHDERAHLDFSSDGLVSHELAHQWFGDLLTTRDWSHAWLNEGFATYCECVWWEAAFGWDEYVYYVFEAVTTYLKEEADKYRRAIVTNVYVDPSELFDRHLYKKGGAVLHLVRGTLGHAPFRAAIARYVRDNAGRSVETIDLVRAIEAATGRNLRELFDRWVLAAGHPVLTCSYHYDDRERAAVATVAQTQTIDEAHPAFAFDVVVGVVMDAPPTLARDAGDGPLPGERRVRVRVDRAERTVTIPVEREPAFVRVDPGAYVLADATYALGTDTHVAILRGEPDVVARIRAARALARDGSRRASDALASSLTADPFWGVSVENRASPRRDARYGRARHAGRRRGASASEGAACRSGGARSVPSDGRDVGGARRALLRCVVFRRRGCAGKPGRDARVRRLLHLALAPRHAVMARYDRRRRAPRSRRTRRRRRRRTLPRLPRERSAAEFARGGDRRDSAAPRDTRSPSRRARRRNRARTRRPAASSPARGDSCGGRTRRPGRACGVDAHRRRRGRRLLATRGSRCRRRDRPRPADAAGDRSLAPRSGRPASRSRDLAGQHAAGPAGALAILW